MSTNWKSDGIVDVAAIAAAVAAAVDVPTVIDVQNGLARTDELQPAVADALAAAVGDELITPAQVTAAVPSAAAIATAVGAQAASAAAISAASLPTAAQIVAALVASGAVSTQQQAACATAIAAAIGTDIPSESDIENACTNAVNGLGIPEAVATLARGGTFTQASVTLTGAGTSGTVISAAPGGTRHYIVAVAAACTVANSTFSLASSGGTTMGAMQLPIGNSFALSIPFGYVIRGGTGTSVTANKTTGATLVINVWYYTAATGP